MDHEVYPLGMMVEEFQILVDDDQQDRHRLQMPTREAHLLIFVCITGTGILEKPVAAGNLSVDRLPHSLR